MFQQVVHVRKALKLRDDHDVHRLCITADFPHFLKSIGSPDTDAGSTAVIIFIFNFKQDAVDLVRGEKSQLLFQDFRLRLITFQIPVDHAQRNGGIVADFKTGDRAGQLKKGLDSVEKSAFRSGVNADGIFCYAQHISIRLCSCISSGERSAAGKFRKTAFFLFFYFQFRKTFPEKHQSFFVQACVIQDGQCIRSACSTRRDQFFHLRNEIHLFSFIYGSLSFILRWVHNISRCRKCKTCR